MRFLRRFAPKSDMLFINVMDLSPYSLIVFIGGNAYAYSHLHPSPLLFPKRQEHAGIIDEEGNKPCDYTLC